MEFAGIVLVEPERKLVHGIERAVEIAKRITQPENVHLVRRFDLPRKLVKSGKFGRGKHAGRNVARRPVHRGGHMIEPGADVRSLPDNIPRSIAFHRITHHFPAAIENHDRCLRIRLRSIETNRGNRVFFADYQVRRGRAHPDGGICKINQAHFINQSLPLSFQFKDHGKRDGRNLAEIKNSLAFPPFRGQCQRRFGQHEFIIVLPAGIDGGGKHSGKQFAFPSGIKSDFEFPACESKLCQILRHHPPVSLIFFRRRSQFCGTAPRFRLPAVSQFSAPVRRRIPRFRIAVEVEFPDKRLPHNREGSGTEQQQ